MNAKESATVDMLVQLIVQRLRERRESAAVISLTSDTSPAETVLLHHQTITVTDVTFGQLQQLLTGVRTPWIQWLDKGLVYECDITIKTAMPVNRMFHPAMILTWPFTFRDKYDKRIYSCKDRCITATTVRAYENDSVLLLFRGQHVTALAQEVMQTKHIDVIEGVVCYADW